MVKSVKINQISRLGPQDSRISPQVITTKNKSQPAIKYREKVKNRTEKNFRGETLKNRNPRIHTHKNPSTHNPIHQHQPILIFPVC